MLIGNTPRDAFDELENSQTKSDACAEGETFWMSADARQLRPLTSAERLSSKQRSLSIRSSGNCSRITRYLDSSLLAFHKLKAFVLYFA